MAFTDHSDIFGSIHEEGINRIVRHIMQQRPSLFNYATRAFHENPELFCARIEAAPLVKEKGNPLFTEQEPLPILGAPIPLGLNFCLQLTDAEIDFHPTSSFELPEQLGGKLAEQRFALRAKACVGIDCPSEDLIDQLIPIMERLVVSKKLGVYEQLKESEDSEKASASLSAGTQDRAARLMASNYELQSRSAMLSSYAMFNQPTSIAPTAGISVDRGNTITLPTRKLICFCLELYVVGHFEWGTVIDPKQQWLKPRLDGIEIVDLQPTPMENAIECYAATVMRLGLLPRLILPMEVMVLNVTEVLKKQGLIIGKQITLSPSVVPTDVPNNPAIEDDMVKAFIKLAVTP
ncbi:MAG: hypothetical protein K8L99_21565 [Anaerolineae bacterium]|nr:hypothetical protein [Anaerolineae bacterium]